MSFLLNLPNELLLQIFYSLPTTYDALRLARTCPQLHELFKNGKNKINILRFAANVPKKFYSGLECPLSECVRSPPSKWWLRDTEGYLVILTIDYSQFSEEDILKNALCDIASIRNSTLKPESQNPILEFLGQFDSMEHRCPSLYDHSLYNPDTVTILKAAARLQEDIVSEMPAIPSDMSSHDTVIALLLNCLAISHRISNVSSFCKMGPDDDDIHYVNDDNHFVKVEEASRGDHGDDHRLTPFMAVHKQLSTTRLPESLINTGWDLWSTVESTLQLAAQLLLEMMLRQDPRDLPKVLYALCIMCLIHSDVDSASNYLSWKGWSIPGDPLISDIWRLYYIYSYGGQPLKSSFDREKYASLVGDYQIAIQHCDLLKKLWFDQHPGIHGDDDEYEVLNDFHDKVDVFSHGYI